MKIVKVSNEYLDFDRILRRINHASSKRERTIGAAGVNDK